VIDSSLRIERLSEAHDPTSFACGNEALDRYLREQAGQDLRRRLAAVFFLCESSANAVRGYYTLSACQVDPRSLPADLARRLPHRPVPAALIGRLAVDLHFRGRSLGGALLADALIRAAGGSREIGAMSVVVGAKEDQARAFYEHYGFRRFTDDQYRLFLSILDAERQAQ
jgi:GNAT superfamily N-acetyltransferase